MNNVCEEKLRYNYQITSSRESQLIISNIQANHNFQQIVEQFLPNSFIELLRKPLYSFILEIVIKYLRHTLMLH